MAKQFPCESCGETIFVHASGPGEEVQCRRCGSDILVPYDCEPATKEAYESYIRMVPASRPEKHPDANAAPASSVDTRFTPEPAARAERARAADAGLALLIAGAATWAIPKFLLVPLFAVFGWKVDWWMYALFFIVAYGSVHSGLTRGRAADKIAYDDAVVRIDSRTRFCSQCGEEMPADARFCPNCGVKAA